MTEQKYINIINSVRLPKPNETEWSKIISKWTGWLIGFLALASFVLSYEALWTFAIDSGVTWWLAWLWPLTLDFFVLVASLSILRNSLNGEPKKYAWAMVVVFTLLSIVFNAIHGGLPLDSYQVYILPYIPIVAYVLPPVAFVFSFHLGMAQIESELKSRTQKKPDKAPEIKQTTQLSTENEGAAPELDRANEARQTKVGERRAGIVQMHQEGKSESQMAETFNVSLKTIQRDMAALQLNGYNIISPQEVEGMGRNGNGKAGG